MERRIGMICGAGTFPALAVSEILKRSGNIAVAGIEGEADPLLAQGPYAFEWIKAGRFGDLVAFFWKHDVSSAILIGKIDPRMLFDTRSWDREAKTVLESVPNKSPVPLLEALIAALAKAGIEVLDPTFLLEPYYCAEGVLSRIAPSAGVEKDMAFGLHIARAAADLDIGQTVVVKDGAIVAVEGTEGTNEAIRRAGKLAGPGIVMAKAARSRQEPRIDVPAVGLETMEALARSRAAGLIIEAGKVAFFQKEEALALANKAGIAVVSRKI